MAKPSHPLTHSKEALEKALARSASSNTRVIQQRLPDWRREAQPPQDKPNHGLR